MQSKQYQIVIIGAGPAGISTALHLLFFDPSLAKEILVVDKASFPRAKLCGGGLTEDAERILCWLGLDVNQIPNQPVKSIDFIVGEHRFAYQSNNAHTIRVVSRIDLDAWLVGAAIERGLTIEQGVEVSHIIEENGGVRLTTSAGVITSKIVVLAEGSNGKLSRQVFTKRQANKARLVEAFEEQKTHNQNAPLIFDYTPIQTGVSGYFWDFPTTGNKRSVGYFDANMGKSQRLNIGNLLSKRTNTTEINGHPILQFTPRHNNQIGHVIAVGDCSGADPLLGEGISFALGSGYYAARHIIRSIKEQDGDPRGYQWELIKSEMGRALYIRWCIAMIIFNANTDFWQSLIWKTLNPTVIWIARNWLLGWAGRIKNPSRE